MDTSREGTINVHRRDGSLMKFREYGSGLYSFDTQGSRAPTNNTSSDENYLFLDTVASNKDQYTQREIDGADRAWLLYKKIGWPSEQVFAQILTNNLIRNCPVTPDDAKWALHIYGPDIATLKGKTVKKQNKGIPNYQSVQIPAPIITRYNNVRLFINIFWVNGSPLFHTISEWIIEQWHQSTTGVRKRSSRKHR
jgi:hypothetical protein